MSTQLNTPFPSRVHDSLDSVPLLPPATIMAPSNHSARWLLKFESKIKTISESTIPDGPSSVVPLVTMRHFWTWQLLPRKRWYRIRRSRSTPTVRWWKAYRKHTHSIHGWTGSLERLPNRPFHSRRAPIWRGTGYTSQRPKIHLKFRYFL